MERIKLEIVKSGALSTYQFRFRKKHSTNDQVQRVTGVTEKTLEII